MYVGLYEKARASHFSYHSDGRRHTRVEGEHKAIRPFKGAPINEITSFVQIVSAGIFLRTGKLISPGTEYVQDDPKTITAIFLDVSVLAKESLSASFCIFARDAEVQYLSSQYKVAEVTRRPIIAAATLALRFFPRHKVGITLSGMNELL